MGISVKSVPSSFLPTTPQYIDRGERQLEARGFCGSVSAWRMASRFELLVAALQSGDRSGYVTGAAATPAMSALLDHMPAASYEIVVGKIASFLPRSSGVAETDADALTAMLQTLSLMGGGKGGSGGGGG